MFIDAIARPPSLVEKVCQSLSEIARRDLQNDDGWLPTERELSAQLGVSRSVVREAAKRLELQGLLEIRQGSGMKVVDKLHRPLSSAVHLLVPDEKQRLVQLTEVRLALEPEHARLAAERAKKVELKKLEECHDRFVTSNDFSAQVESDMEFHRLIAEASGNKIGALLISSLSDLLVSSLSHGYKLVTKDQAVLDHGKILKAILARDPAAAAKAMRTHLEHARTDLGL